LAWFLDVSVTRANGRGLNT